MGIPLTGNGVVGLCYKAAAWVFTSCKFLRPPHYFFDVNLHSPQGNLKASRYQRQRMFPLFDGNQPNFLAVVP